MQIQPFNLFYRKYGVRSIEQISTPMPRVLVDMPKNVALHCFDEGQSLFPDSSNPFMEGSKKRIALLNHTELLDKSHTVSRLTTPINQQVQEFIRSNRKFVITKEPFDKLKDELTLVVNNYNPIKNFYKYSPSIPMNLYWRWFDTQNTVWSVVNQQASVSNRNHYVFIDVPKTVPAKSRLMASEGANAAAMLKFFATPEEFFLLDLWRWVNPETRSLSSLGNIKTENLPKINLMLKLEDGRYVSLNLGYINSWIEGQPNQTDRKSITQRKPVIVSTMLLLYMVRVQSASLMDDSDDEAFVEDMDNLEEGTARSFPTDPTGQSDSEDQDDEEDYSQGIGGHGKEKSSIKASKDSLNKSINSLKNKEEKAEDSETVEDTLVKAEEELEALEEMSRHREAIRVVEEPEAYDPDAGASREETEKNIFGVRKPIERLVEQLDKVAAIGTMNAADYRKLLKIVEKQESMTDPYGSGEPLYESIKISKEDQEFKPKDIELAGDERILDPTMKTSVIEAFDKQYVEKVMRKDVMSTILGIQNSGVVITNINTEIYKSITGSFEIHSVTIKPIRGETSTLRIRIPVIDSDGTYKANNVRYHMRKQRVDQNIRKTDPSRVGISSYTGKLSVSRPSRQAQSEIASVFKKLNRGAIGEEPIVPKVVSANVLDTEFDAPYIFNVMSEKYKGFTVKHEIFGELNFDFSEKVKDGTSVLCGKTSKGHQIVVDADDNFSITTPNGKQELGNIHKVLDIDRTQVPVDAAILKVVGQQLPVGLILCRAVGLRGLIKLLKCKYRTEESKKRKNLEPHEYAVTFKNIRYVFDRRDKQAAMILGGLTHFEKQIKSYDAEIFDKKDIYNHLLETMGCRVSVGRELDHLETSYVDPVTARSLEKIGEPQNFLGLLVRSAQHLTNYSSPPPQDMDVQVIRGYERIAGAVHKQLYKAMRTFKNKNISTRTKVDMGHFAVWQAIREDPAIKTCEDINPIQNLKMHESVTFVGEGGRSKEAFMKNDRAYNTTDAGVISEASVDSGDVGINIFLAANPKLGDVSGMKKDDGKALGAGNYFSSSLMLAAGAQYDDMRRNGFVSIQNSHTIPCEGYHQPYIQTGYESLALQRNDKIFGLAAKQDGKVIGLTEKAVRVLYEDGTEDSCPIGRQYGSAEGSTYPHDIVPMVVENAKFKKGDAICYHTGFYEPDFLDPKKVVMKFGMVVNTAFMEDTRTHEDSCAISKKLSAKMRSKTTKVKSYVVDFEQALHNVQKPGVQLEPEDVLMVIENSISIGVGNFDAESMATLKNAGTPAPRSSYTGSLDRIDIYYHGDKSDMHPSLKSLADRSDRFFGDQEKDMGRTALTGRVDGDFSVKGKPLLLNQAEIRFYITVEHAMSPGDKGVFANQLKTTVGEEMDFDMVTESGVEVEAMFGGRSALKRIVNSYALMGTATGNLQATAEHMVKMWEGK